MSNITNEQLIEHIASMSVLELSKLVKELEEKFGVSAAATAVAAPAAVAGDGEDKQVEEKTEFDVVLTSEGDKKIAVIKEVRTITGLGLKEAKDLVQSAGADCKVKEGVSKDEADAIAKKLTEAGATVEVK